MSREFNQAVRRLFDAGMRQFPEFPATKAPRAEALPGERCYSAATGLNVAWICLLPSLKGLNEFSVEFGWCTRGGYPGLIDRPTVSRFEGIDTLRKFPAGFARLKSSGGGWWTVADGETDVLAAAQAQTRQLTRGEATQLAEPLVADALHVVRAHALPYSEIVRSYQP